MMKRWLLALALCGISAPAWAVCGVTNLQVKDNAAVTAAVPYADDGSGGSNCSPQVQLKQGGNVAAVTSNSALKVEGTGASGAALAGSPFRIGLSDGTNTQNWLANIALNPTTGVNGNNTAAVGPWIWDAGNGFYVAQPGTAKGAWGIIRDAAGNARGANVDANNNLTIGQATAANLNATVVGTGTFAVQATLAAETTKVIGTVNQGTSPWVVSGTVTANQGTSPWVVSNGGTFAVQAAIPTWAGGTLGAMANYGTSPGAVLVPGVNAFITNAPALGAHNTANSSTVNIASDQAGTCTLHAFKHITSATDTLAVQGVTAQTISICAWKSRAAGTATWFWENTGDTNANCAGSKTQISGVSTEAANTGEVVSLPLGVVLSNTSGNGLCINSTGTGGVDIDYWYAQR